MKELKGTKTEANVKAAFAGEAQARNKYNYYALQAKQQGEEKIAALFEKMADNEKEHAKVWFKIMNNGLGTVEANLADASIGEGYECNTMYPTFAAQAKEEGFDDLANMFERVSAIERDHEKTFLLTLSQHLESQGSAPKENHVELPKTPKSVHRCMFCGNIEEKREDVCHVCGAIGSFEQVTILV